MTSSTARRLPVSFVVPRHLRCAATVATVVLGLSAGGVNGEPVWVSQGTSHGQGTTLSLAGACFVYTAGHVVKADGGPIELVNVEGYRAGATVRAIDSRLDLALLEIEPGPRRRNEVCARKVVFSMLRNDDTDTGVSSGASIWLDRVASAAGGLDRFDMALAPDGAGKDVYELVPTAYASQKVRVPARMPQQGDSGARISVDVRAGGSRSRYFMKGGPDPNQRAPVLGVLSSVRNDRAIVVRSERVHEFIMNALRPVDWSEIGVGPGEATIAHWQRGALGAGRIGSDLPLNNSALDQIGIEIDLGDQDTNLAAVAIEVMPTSPAAGQRAQKLSLSLASSQYQPGDTAAKWTRQKCSLADTPPPAGVRSRGGYWKVCTLDDSRVARGLRVDLIGRDYTLQQIWVLAPK